MYDNGEIRAQAWKLSKKHFGKLIGIMLFIMVVPVVLVLAISLPMMLLESAASTGLFLLVYLIIMLIIPPVALGCTRLSLQLWRGGDIHFKDLFYYLTRIKLYGKALLLTLLIGVIVFVVMLIPIIGAFIVIWVELRLFLAFWLFVSDERLTVIECIKFSFELMKGHCWRCFCMMFLVGLIWAGIVLVVLVPIMVVGAALESLVMTIIAVPLMLCSYAAFLPFYMLSMTGFAAGLIPTPPTAAVYSTPELQ